MQLTPIMHSKVRPAVRFSRSASLVLALLLALTAMLPPATARRTEAAGPVRVRIGVVKDGITKVTPADLANADPNLAGANPNTFALSSLGQPVAIHVTDDGNGIFDGGDALYFFGEKFRGPEMDQKYTDERVYWLDIGGATGPRIEVRDATPQYDRTPPTDFATTLRAEESNVWWTLYTLGLDTQDTWFWSRLSPVALSAGAAAPAVERRSEPDQIWNGILAQTATADLPYVVPYPAAAAATLRLEEISNAYVWNLNPDHRTVATLNGATILDENWDGLSVRKVFNAPVPAGGLTHGTNTLTVSAMLLPGVPNDDIYVNYWELDYRRLFRAWGDRLDFRSEEGGIQEYAASGWSSPETLIWDITDTKHPVRLSAPPASGPDVTVRFRVNTTVGSRYWIQTATTAEAPASIRIRPPTGLRNPAGGADAVIVTSAELRVAAEQLAGWHRAHDRRALVVDIQDAYDEFNDGIFHPKAVQVMMKWAVANWQSPAPAYLTLVGDGHWNFKGNNQAVYPLQPQHIPPFLAWVDPWQGEVPADAQFGDIDDDRVPEIAVGRLAVNTLAEARTVVDKIVSYDENLRIADWQRRALFVADNPDSSGDFPAVSDEIIAGYTPTDLQVVRAYLPGDAVTPATPEQIAATHSTLADALQAGAFMVQFTGHGAPERWTHESIWRSSHIPALVNGEKLPLIMTFNCLDGYFAHPDPARFSIAELMQRHAGGGSIAAVSPSGLGTTSHQLAFRKILLDVMFKDNIREVGVALTIAKQQFSQVYGKHYLIDTMTLFGDPAMRLPASPTRLFLPVVTR